jgi:hypothetical protein
MHFIIESNVLIIQWHNLIENNTEITIHDALCAYIILTLNKHFFSTTDEYIRCVHMVVNYRGVCNRLAPIGYVGNYVTSSDVLCRQFIKDGRINFIFGSKEFIFNSNFKYD